MKTKMNSGYNDILTNNIVNCDSCNERILDITDLYKTLFLHASCKKNEDEGYSLFDKNYGFIYRNITCKCDKCDKIVNSGSDLIKMIFIYKKCETDERIGYKDISEYLVELQKECVILLPFTLIK